MIKKILKPILKFIKDSFYFISFLSRVVYNGNYRNNLKKSTIKTAVVLANGPSLKKEIPKLNIAEEFNGVDFIVLNYFANQQVFFQIKPKHYCFADPMFFENTHRQQEAKSIFSILQNKVDWDMNIYVPSNRFKNFKIFSGVNNKYITIVKMNTTPYGGYKSFRNFFYKKGLAMPIPGTVANLAIFVALNSGFKEIRLYGVDHTFFDSLCVNEKNQLCNKESHFYGNKTKTEPIPIIRTDNSEVFKMSEYLTAIGQMFKSHDLLVHYAKYLNVEIINYTKISLIDSYKRAVNN